LRRVRRGASGAQTAELIRAIEVPNGADVIDAFQDPRAKRKDTRRRVEAFWDANCNERKTRRPNPLFASQIGSRSLPTFALETQVVR
jgi:hypothetical protein